MTPFLTTNPYAIAFLVGYVFCKVWKARNRRDD